MLENIYSKIGFGILDWFLSRERLEIEIKPLIINTSIFPFGFSSVTIKEIIIEITNVGKTPVKVEGIGFFKMEGCSYSDENLHLLDLEKKLQLPLTLNSKQFFSFKLSPSFYRLLISENKILTVRGDKAKFWKLKKEEVNFHKDSIKEGLKISNNGMSEWASEEDAVYDSL